MTADRLALTVAIAAVLLLGAAAAYVLLTGRPAPAPPAEPALSPADVEDLLTECIRITREAAGGG